MYLYLFYKIKIYYINWANKVSKMSIVFPKSLKWWRCMKLCLLTYENYDIFNWRKSKLKDTQFQLRFFFNFTFTLIRLLSYIKWRNFKLWLSSNFTRGGTAMNDLVVLTNECNLMRAINFDSVTDSFAKLATRWMVV